VFITVVWVQFLCVYQESMVASSNLQKEHINEGKQWVKKENY
jgi:hypothetical protein